jgi:aminoglycoside phosphotransferase (APT) family kinase protein
LPDDRVGFLDWQVVRRGDHCLDVGYFLQGALTIEDRRTSETDLLAHYHHALTLPDAECPTFDDVWLRYRASVAHGLTVWLATAASTWQRPEVSLTLTERYAAAFSDLDSPAAINRIARD